MIRNFAPEINKKIGCKKYTERSCRRRTEKFPPST